MIRHRRSGDAAPRKRLVLLLAVNVVSIALMFVLAEVYLHSQGHYTYNRTYPGQYRDGPGVAWVEDDDELGWIARADFLPGEINPQGFRDPSDFSALPDNSEKRRVLIVGDSFVYGAGVGAEASFPGLLRATLEQTHEVYAIGVPGWGIDQMYLAYERYADAIDPDVVVLAFIDDDVDRVLEAYRRWEKLTKPSFEVEDGELVPQRPIGRIQRRIEALIGRSILLSTVLREFYVMTEARPVVSNLVEAIANDVRLRGGHFAVVRIPTGDQPYASKRFRRWMIDYEELFATLDVPYFDSAEALLSDPNWGALLYLEDGHLNAYGNELLARFVLDRVIQRPQ